ncbi:hypothetical protein [Metabacillus halosaccharovorans]|uniref:hypothetical protein n=1 Tax=Metabacillus halosaccharovorans TaxID=930124 RepID=UPI0014743C33|nr:hypothetical protein [Metabacillus halosaccharovorans]
MIRVLVFTFFLLSVVIGCSNEKEVNLEEGDEGFRHVIAIEKGVEKMNLQI